MAQVKHRGCTLSRIAVEVAGAPQTVEQPGTTEAFAGRPSDGIPRLTAGLPVPLVLERGPRVASASATDAYLPPWTPESATRWCGRRAVAADGDDVAGARDLGALGNAEVHEPVVLGATRHALGLDVLASLGGCHEDIHLAPLEAPVLGPADLLWRQMSRSKRSGATALGT